MLEITLNGEPRTLPQPLSVEELLDQLGYDRRRTAVEVNCAVVPRTEQPKRRLVMGDRVEIVTLVGGGSGAGVKDEGGRMNDESGIKSPHFLPPSELILHPLEAPEDK